MKEDAGTQITVEVPQIHLSRNDTSYILENWKENNNEINEEEKLLRKLVQRNPNQEKGGDKEKLLSFISKIAQSSLIAQDPWGNRSEVRSVMGVFNQFRHFFERCDRMVAPILKLLKINQP